MRILWNVSLHIFIISPCFKITALECYHPDTKSTKKRQEYIEWHSEELSNEVLFGFKEEMWQSPFSIMLWMATDFGLMKYMCKSKSISEIKNSWKLLKLIVSTGLQTQFMSSKHTVIHSMISGYPPLIAKRNSNLLDVQVFVFWVKVCSLPEDMWRQKDIKW